jgi:hypothetical protein
MKDTYLDVRVKDEQGVSRQIVIAWREIIGGGFNLDYALLNALWDNIRFYRGGFLKQH